MPKTAMRRFCVLLALMMFFTTSLQMIISLENEIRLYNATINSVSAMITILLIVTMNLIMLSYCLISLFFKKTIV